MKLTNEMELNGMASKWLANKFAQYSDRLSPLASNSNKPITYTHRRLYRIHIYMVCSVCNRNNCLYVDNFTSLVLVRGNFYDISAQECSAHSVSQHIHIFINVYTRRVYLRIACVNLCL